MRLYRPTRPPVNAQSAQKGSPSMGAGTKRLRGGPFRPYRTHHPWLPLQGSCLRSRLRGRHKFAATSPSRLRRATSPGRGGLGSAHSKGFHYEGKLPPQAADEVGCVAQTEVPPPHPSRLPPCHLPLIGEGIAPPTDILYDHTKPRPSFLWSVFCFCPAARSGENS